METLTKKEKRELKRQEKLGAKERNVKTRLLKRVVIWGAAFLLLGGAVAGGPTGAEPAHRGSARRDPSTRG